MPDQISSIRENVIDPNSWDETSRRIRAAIAWKGSSKQFGRRGAAEAMNVEPGEVDRMTGTKPVLMGYAGWIGSVRIEGRDGLPYAQWSRGGNLCRIYDL